jgi:hypothetical protein
MRLDEEKVSCLERVATVNVQSGLGLLGQSAVISICQKLLSAALSCCALLILFAAPARAQHGDWLMGTDGLLSGQQAPQGMYYSNIWSYYHASGSDFAEIRSVEVRSIRPGLPWPEPGW